MLIPGIVAVALWLVASGYLVFTGFYDREVASSVRSVSIPAVTGLSSVQQERRLSIAYLTEPSRGLQALIEQRRQTDQRLSALRTVADSALKLAPGSIKTRWKALTDYLDRLPGVRSTVDAGSADQQDVYDFYNGLLDTATDLFDTQARVVPDVTATQGGIAATETFRVSDLMSRAGSMMTGAFGSRRLSQDQYLDFVKLVAAYHAKLTDVAPHLRPDVKKQHDAIVAGASWRKLVAAENALIESGPWTQGIPHGLPVTAASWDELTSQVSDDLIKITIAQADEVSAEALRTGNNQLLTALLGSLIAFAVVVGAIVWAIRQSQVLVDRALMSTRLAQLGKDAAAVVDKRLPDMMARIRRREKLDPAAELLRQDYGADEIGQLAGVLRRSLQVAVGAAVEEATTRAAGTAMLMGVARRLQRPLQRALQVIEDLQKGIDDEDLLAELFDVNHQLAQTRRFLENLIVLAGGQTGRRFHKPVPLRRVLLAAIAETQQYRRVTIRRTVDVSLAGGAVASTTHLLSELLDNALAFSPPRSEVWVSCIMARRGVVIEIEDAGVGMIPEDLERANGLLASAPTPDLTLLKDGSQVGLWVVAELAKRGGTQVTFRTSAYGGLLAIVLLPDRVIASDADVLTLDTVSAATVGPVPDTAASLLSSEPLPPTPLPGGPAPHKVGVRDELPTTSAPAVIVGALDAGGARRPGHELNSGGRPTDGPGGMMNDRRPNNIVADPVRPEFLSSSGGSASRLTVPRPALPERQPQQHLAPELRDDNAAGAASWRSAEPARSPEETRERFTRYQQGWRAGRTGNTNQE